MTIQEVIRHIDEYGGYTPFVITVCKADGKLRDMVAMKRNKQRLPGGTSKEGTNFKYSLQQKGVMLINELHGFPTEPVNTPTGTHLKLKQEVRADQIQLRKDHKTYPKSIKMFAIRSFNGNKVIHV